MFETEMLMQSLKSLNAKRVGYIRFRIAGNVGVRKSKLLSAPSNFLFLCKC